jgi:signal transduction histidine kinase
MTLLRTGSIASRLTRMNLLVSGSVLLIAALAFFSYDLLSFRNSLIQNLDTEARIVGENSVSALTFNDPQSATTTLKSLQNSPDILAATITTPEGAEFARFGTAVPGETESHRLEGGESEHAWPSGAYVLVAHRVEFQGKQVGVVYICAQLREIRQRARRYLSIAGVILLFCMAASLLISASSRHLIAQPIMALAETARLVSRDRDYSIRAPIREDSSEIAVLGHAFNAMLDQIQERDAALNEARAGLEARVEERTAELQTANRELEAFSYTVAHDLRGPLDAIGSIAFLLEQSLAGDSDGEVQSMIAKLKVSTGNMGSLIDDLLNFARASTTTVQSERVDLSAIAREIGAELKATDPARHVDFDIHAVPEVQADAGLMRIVLDNLLRNSWKYSSRHEKACIELGAKVSVTADGTAGQVVYFVRDDGAGFDPARIGRLFQPFQRLHDKGDFPGTGIGLATVQRILARHGGEIWAESEVEKGATFYFTLGPQAETASYVN